MVALYRSGRQADALDRYRQVRTLLGEELGIPPSSTLQDLEAMILRQDDALAIRAGAGAGAGAGAEPDVPVTRFARGPAGRLAYQVLGDGPASPDEPDDLVFLPGFGGNVEIRWEEPNLSRLYRRLARSRRLVLLDRRGTGLSDRDTGVPPIEEQVDDVLAVMDAAGVERAALFGVMDGGALALLVAARHPQRVRAVATYACFAAYELLGADADERFATLPRPDRPRAPARRGAARSWRPDRVDDVAFAQWIGRYMRLAAGVGGAAAVLDRFQQLDVRSALADVVAPVLALHREHDRFIPASNAAYIADQRGRRAGGDPPRRRQRHLVRRRRHARRPHRGVPRPPHRRHRPHWAGGCTAGGLTRSASQGCASPSRLGGLPWRAGATVDRNSSGWHWRGSLPRKVRSAMGRALWALSTRTVTVRT